MLPTIQIVTRICTCDDEQFMFCYFVAIGSFTVNTVISDKSVLTINYSAAKKRLLTLSLASF